MPSKARLSVLCLSLILYTLCQLSTCSTFRVTLQTAPSGWLGSSCACGQHLQGPYLHPQLLWQEDLPATIWRNSWHIKYRQLFTTEQCWFALKMLEAVYKHGKVGHWSLAAPRNGQLLRQTACGTWETVLAPHVVSNLLQLRLHARAWQMTDVLHFRPYAHYSSWREKDKEIEGEDEGKPGRPFLPPPHHPWKQPWGNQLRAHVQLMGQTPSFSTLFMRTSMLL